MDDVYCPICRLVLERRGVGRLAPQHCPRCVARSRRLVTLLPLDRLPEAAPERDTAGPAPGQRPPVG